jgi:hypothetical protein
VTNRTFTFLPDIEPSPFTRKAIIRRNRQHLDIRNQIPCSFLCLFSERTKISP